MEVKLLDEPDEGEEDGENNSLVNGSPCDIKIYPNSSDLTKCEIEGIGSQTAVAGVENNFFLSTKDKFGNNRF
jgi:hypothetical protein